MYTYPATSDLSADLGSPAHAVSTWSNIALVCKQWTDMTARHMHGLFANRLAHQYFHHIIACQQRHNAAQAFRHGQASQAVRLTVYSLSVRHSM